MGQTLPRRHAVLALAAALALLPLATPRTADAQSICYWSGYRYSTVTARGDAATTLKTTVKYQTAHECSGNPIYIKVNQITATYKATDRDNFNKLHIIRVMRIVQAPDYYGTWDDIDDEGACWNICTVTEIEYPNYTIAYHTKDSVYFYCENCRVVVGGIVFFHHFITNKVCTNVDCST